MTSTTRSITFREDDGEPRFTISTAHPVYQQGSGVVVQITMAGENFPTGELDAGEVEELHQFTYDILAGPRRDPRLEIVDAQIMCGERVTRATGADIECCLYAGHSRIANCDHVTAEGELFNTPGF